MLFPLMDESVKWSYLIYLCMWIYACIRMCSCIFFYFILFIFLSFLFNFSFFSCLFSFFLFSHFSHCFSFRFFAFSSPFFPLLFFPFLCYFLIHERIYHTDNFTGKEHAFGTNWKGNRRESFYFFGVILSGLR